MSTIKLQSSDGIMFTVHVKVATCSSTIRSMIENLGMDERDNDPIPLGNVTANVLEKILEWATHHRDDPPLTEKEEKERLHDPLSKWDAEFLRQNEHMLHDLTMAANYLDIKGLLNTTCKRYANMMLEKSPEEIRKMFNIKCDFTPEELEQIRRENEWCEEK